MTEFDWTMLDQLTEEVGSEVLPRLLRTFYGEAVAKIAEFEALSEAALSGERGDAAAMHRAVHSLKSAAGSFGATSLAAVAADIEQRIEDGAYAHDAPAIGALRDRFEAFKSAVAARGISVA